MDDAATHLMLIVRELRELGLDAPLVRLSDDGVTQTDLTLTDELALIAMTTQCGQFLLRLLRIAADDPGLDPGSLEFAVVTGGTYYPFERGEIIALPKDGHREIRDGRSTSKYDVEIERFGTDYEAASRRSDEVRQ